MKKERDVFQKPLSSYYLTNQQTYFLKEINIVLKFSSKSSQEFKQSSNYNSETDIV